MSAFESVAQSLTGLLHRPKDMALIPRMCIESWVQCGPEEADKRTPRAHGLAKSGQVVTSVFSEKPYLKK